MKTSLKSLALVIAVSYPCVAFADFIGVHVPLEIGAEGMFGLFLVALTGLISVADYSRRSRPLSLRARCGETAREVNRLAA